MNPKTKKTVVIISIVAISALAIAGVAILVTNARKKRNASEIEDLLTIAKNEGKMSQSNYEKYRRLIYMQNYSLPAMLQNAFNKIRPMLQSAGNGIRSGYAVSSMQYFQQIRDAIANEPQQVKSQYAKVEALLKEAFKLDATSSNYQEKINSSTSKSRSWWQSLLYLHPIGIVYNTATGYTESKWNELKLAYQKATDGLVQENINFNQKLLSEPFDTLKLFNDSYKALSGGKDYFEIQKTPMA